MFDAAADYLAQVDLDVDPRRRFGSLRGGERELAAVARALATAPRVLILDEVTAQLRIPATCCRCWTGCAKAAWPSC